MAGKRVSLASLASEKVETVPGASRPDLLHVPPNSVAPTPLNPRRAFDETELVELGEDMRAGQLQPCVAVNRAAYLRLYPEHADRLPGDCRYVMAAGERRWRAAVKVGLDSLDVMVRHDLTESRIRFLAAVLSENVQRANFNPIEEADGLRAMLDLHDGNQAAAARAMGKSKQWFNQRIGLLRLTDEMVQLVLEGKLTAFRDMRRYAAMEPQEQYAAWRADQEQPRQPKPSAAAATPASGGYTAVYPQGTPPSEDAQPAPQQESAPQGYTAVYPPAGSPATEPPTIPAASTGSSGLQNPVLNAAPPRPQPAVPEPRHIAAEQAAPGVPGTGDQEPPRFPYGDGFSAARHLILKMPTDQFVTALRVMLQHAEQEGLEVPDRAS